MSLTVSDLFGTFENNSAFFFNKRMNKLFNKDLKSKWVKSFSDSNQPAVALSRVLRILHPFERYMKLIY